MACLNSRHLLPSGAPPLPPPLPLEVHTIGHSNHPIEAFLPLLARHDITAIADVRSAPWSRRNPQYCREALAAALAGRGIAYVFLGRELGARPADPACLLDGRVSYALLAGTAPFRQGLARVRAGAGRHRLALMCAERDPLDCHRTLLVARQLMRGGMTVRHILADGGIETGEAAEARLLARHGLAEGDLFRSREALLKAAYRSAEVGGRKSEVRARNVESEASRQASLPRAAPEEAEALDFIQQAADRGDDR